MPRLVVRMRSPRARRSSPQCQGHRLAANAFFRRAGPVESPVVSSRPSLSLSSSPAQSCVSPQRSSGNRGPGAAFGVARPEVPARVLSRPLSSLPLFFSLSSRPALSRRRARRSRRIRQLRDNAKRAKGTPEAPCVLHKKKEQNKRPFSVQHVDTPNRVIGVICGAGAACIAPPNNYYQHTLAVSLIVVVVSLATSDISSLVNPDDRFHQLV